MKQKVSDYIFDFLLSKGINQIFSVSGGAAAHLLESVREKNIPITFNYHEQACAMAADGYARIANKPACVLVTNGPGVSNTLTGVLGAYQDSIPMFIISGQVPTNQMISSKNIRQLGVQEMAIFPTVTGITNEFATLKKDDLDLLDLILEDLYNEMMNGRKGPVWLEVPLDIQNTIIETEDFKSQVRIQFASKKRIQYDEVDYKNIISLIKKAKRPVIIAGNGIHLSQMKYQFHDLIWDLGIPIVTTWNAKDLFAYKFDLNIGTFGLMGERAGNFAVQNADLLLILGSRLSIPNIGYKSELFSPNSIKIMVDIDKNEMIKPTLNIDYKIKSDLKEFIPNLIEEIRNDKYRVSQRKLTVINWVKKCQSWKEKYPVSQPEYKTNKERVNSFYFIEVLSKHLTDNHIVVTDMGTAFTCTFQALKCNGKNRLFTSSGTCSMGFGLPGAIGAWFADKSKDIILIAGDGGFQMNIQELQTVIHHKIPIKIFVLNNNGYLAISLMQDNLFEGKYIGSTPESGVSVPDFCKISKAYGIDMSYKILNNSNLENWMPSILNHEGPVFCEIGMVFNQPLIPKVQSIKDKDGKITSVGLEHMYPFLPKEEMDEIMNNE